MLQVLYSLWSYNLLLLSANWILSQAQAVFPYPDPYYRSIFAPYDSQPYPAQPYPAQPYPGQPMVC